MAKGRPLHYPLRNWARCGIPRCRRSGRRMPRSWEGVSQVENLPRRRLDSSETRGLAWLLSNCNLIVKYQMYPYNPPCYRSLLSFLQGCESSCEGLEVVFFVCWRCGCRFGDCWGGGSGSRCTCGLLIFSRREAGYGWTFGGRLGYFYSSGGEICRDGGFKLSRFADCFLSKISKERAH